MHKCGLGILVCVATWAAWPGAAVAWTEPLLLSDHVNDVQWPRLCASASGGVHLIYRYRFRPWRIVYRFRDANGNWGPIEFPMNMPFQDTPWIVEDREGCPHIFFAGGPDGNWPEHWTQIYESVKKNGVWTTRQVTPWEATHQGYPRVAVDLEARMHLLYVKVDLNKSTRADVCYRELNGSAVSSETYLGQIDNFYYHHPTITRDASDRVHAAWVDRGGPRNAVIYRRKDGYTWSAPATVGTSVTNNYITFPAITVLGNTIVVAANDDNNGSAALIKAAASDDGGITWGGFNTIVQGTYVSFAADPLGAIHMAYAWPGETATGYTLWQGSGWATPVRLTAPTLWQLSPDIAMDSAGILHVAYEDYVTAPPPHIISYINSQVPEPRPALGTISGTVCDQYGAAVPNAVVNTNTGLSAGTGPDGRFAIGSPVGTFSVSAARRDFTGQSHSNVTVAANQASIVNFTIIGQPPAAVTSLSVATASTTNTLQWINPANPQFSATRVVYRTDRAPRSPDDGTLLADDAATPGTTRSITHTALTNGVMYYYAAFAYFDDSSRFYASGVHASGAASVRPDMDHDGDVDQADFGLFQGCYSGAYNPQLLPECQQAKLDADADVDPDDAAVFIRCMSGANVYANETCAD